MTHHWGDAAQHYPDVIEMGGAPLAWQAEFDRQGLHENHGYHSVGRDLRAFVEPAFHEPRLRALRPYTSHANLHFSSTDRRPFPSDHPAVRPTETRDRFTVRTRDGRLHEDLDGPEALRIVLADLPEPA